MGRSAAGNLLTLIFTRRGEKLRPISCRRMRKEEKALYEKSVKNAAS
ncbi:MAG: BrnT family toxin [Elusimicrobia bacterium]|nr:BrnT family toxin [Elusimicrobiota bacterium]